MDKQQQPRQPDVAAIIERWFMVHFHDSPIARDTELYNLVHAAKEDLKARLTKGE